MSYPISLTFYTTAGLADLRAQIYDSAGANSGAAISTGFIERGTNGMYNWFGVADDGFVGGVEVYSLADASNILAIRDINPREVENSDVKASTLATASSLSTVASGVASILDDTGTSGVVISTAVMQAMADVILGRSVATVEGTASTNSLAEAILGLLESTTVGTTWTIKKTDGSATFNTRTLTLDDTARPVVGVTGA